MLLNQGAHERLIAAALLKIILVPGRGGVDVCAEFERRNPGTSVMSRQYPELLAIYVMGNTTHAE
jgi:hypothetical protein